MLPFGIGFSEVALILVVVLLVVGPQKLPEIARTLGKGIRTARRAGQELRDAIEVDEIRRSVYDHTVRPWQQATDIEDAQVDERHATAAAAAAAVAMGKGGGAPSDDDHPDAVDESDEADDEAPNGPIARGAGPIMPAPRPERPAEPEPIVDEDPVDRPS